MDQTNFVMTSNQLVITTRTSSCFPLASCDNHHAKVLQYNHIQTQKLLIKYVHSICRQKQPAISNHVSMPSEKRAKQELLYCFPEMKKETPVCEALCCCRNEKKALCLRKLKKP